MALRLFSVGYQGRTLDGLVELLRAHRVKTVIDVRDLPWSRKPGFSKGALSAGLDAAGIAYTHARFAGNPRSLRLAARDHADSLARFERHLTRRPEVVAELDETFRGLPASRQAVALLCYERHPADCHRSILLQHWRQATEDTATPIVHLDPEGAPRFTDRVLAPSGAPNRGVVGTTSR